MLQRRWTIVAVVAIVAACIIAGVLLTLPATEPQNSPVVGAVLVQNSDVSKQTPISEVHVTASAGVATGSATTDSSGFFSIRLTPPVRRGQPVALSFRREGYQRVDLVQRIPSPIVLAYMAPVPARTATSASGPEAVLSDIRLRYSENTEISADIGSIAKTFEVENTNGVPCDERSPCSPNGRWKASERSISFDAGPQSAYHNVRISCISGPCPFTKIRNESLSDNGRLLSISVLDWSDTTTFLVEAELVQHKPASIVRQSYPVEFGETLDFALPPSAEGPAIEAELNGEDIVFPLGPELILPWASCTTKLQQDSSRLFRCDLKPGYRFK
jgi:hypothetical protein